MITQQPPGSLPTGLTSLLSLHVVEAGGSLGGRRTRGGRGVITLGREDSPALVGGPVGHGDAHSVLAVGDEARQGDTARGRPSAAGGHQAA